MLTITNNFSHLSDAQQFMKTKMKLEYGDIIYFKQLNSLFKKYMLQLRNAYFLTHKQIENIKYEMYQIYCVPELHNRICL